MGFNTSGCSQGFALDDNFLKVDIPTNVIINEEESPCQLHILSTQILLGVLGCLNLLVGLICLRATLMKRGKNGNKTSTILRLLFFFGGICCLVLGSLAILIASGSANRQSSWALLSAYFTFFFLVGTCTIRVVLDVLRAMLNSAAGDTFMKIVYKRSTLFKCLFVVYNFSFFTAAVSFWIFTGIMGDRRLFKQQLLSYQIGCVTFGIGMGSLILEIVYVFGMFADFIEDTINSAPAVKMEGTATLKFNDRARDLVGRFRKLRLAMKLNSVLSCGLFVLHAFLIPIYTTYILPLHCLNNIVAWITCLYTFFPGVFSKRILLPGYEAYQRSMLLNKSLQMQSNTLSPSPQKKRT